MARKDTQCGVLKSGYAESSCYRVHFGTDGQLKLLDEVRSPWLSWARTLVRRHILIVAAIFAHRVFVGVDSAADRDRRVLSACRRRLLHSVGGRWGHRSDYPVKLLRRCQIEHPNAGGD